MNKLALVFCLTLLVAGAATPAEAQNRPLTRAMSCAAAQNLVSSRGAIVLNTDQFIYDRYVRNAGFCPNQQTTRAAMVPTKDNANCFIGFTCTEIEIDNWR